MIPRELLERPFLTSELPGTGGAFKRELEDFRVEEIPAYEPSGEGQHLYVRVEKRDVSAHDLVRRLAQHFDVRKRDIGMAGMKDRRAVTRQWISLPAHEIDAGPDEVVGEVDEQIEILSAAFHRNKLRRGHVWANRFDVVVRDLGVDPAVAERRAGATMKRLDRGGVPNYYGLQRFGNGFRTLEMGLDLLAGDEATKRHLDRNRRLKRLAVNSVQSAVFNRVLALRIEDGTVNTPLVGDRLDRVGERGQLLVEEDNLEEARTGVASGELVVSGPMPGPDIYEPRGEVRRLELAVYDEFGLDDETFAPYSRFAGGLRRPLTVPFVSDPWTVEPAGDDALRLRFSLPSGSYATIVLREVLKSEEMRDG